MWHCVSIFGTDVYQCARLSDWRGTIILVLAIVLLTTAHFLAIYHKHGWRMNLAALHSFHLPVGTGTWRSSLETGIAHKTAFIRHPFDATTPLPLGI